MKKKDGLMTALLASALLLILAACGRATATPTPTDIEPPGPVSTATQAAPTAAPTSTATALPEPVEVEVEAAALCSPNYVDPVAFFRDNRRLLLREAAGVQIFDLERLEEETALVSDQSVYKAALSPDESLIAWALEDNSIQVLTVEDGQVLTTIPAAHQGMISALKFSPDGARLYSGSHDGWVKVWTREGELRDEFQPGGGEVYGLGVSPNEQFLAVVTFEGPPLVWDIAGKRKLTDLAGGGAFDGADAWFTADGERVAVQYGGGPVALFSIPDGVLRWSGGNFALALSPDGETIAYSADSDAFEPLVMLRPLSGAERLVSLEGHSSLVWKVLFSPDSSLLLSVSDPQLRIWRAAEAEEVLTILNPCP